MILTENQAKALAEQQLNFPLDSIANYPDLLAMIRQQFKVFRPVSIRCWSKHRIPDLHCGNIYMIANYRDYLNLNNWPQETAIQLIQINDDSFYNWYLDQYRNFHRKHPQSFWVSPSIALKRCRSA